MSDVNEVFTDIYKKNIWKSSESISGTGSELSETSTVIDNLPKIFKQFDIKSVLDLPCGDFNWMKTVNLSGIEYIGGDVVDAIVSKNIAEYASEHITFKHINLLEDPLPKVDLIFCRDCLVHFSIADIYKALDNICNSNSKFLLTTTFTGRPTTGDIPTGDWRPINLQNQPFNLPQPIEIINEGCTQDNGAFRDKSLGLWDISKIRRKYEYI